MSDQFRTHCCVHTALYVFAQPFDLTFFRRGLSGPAGYERTGFITSLFRRFARKLLFMVIWIEDDEVCRRGRSV